MVSGICIIEDKNCTEPREVKLSVKERLLSWPWRPWKSFKIVQVPSPVIHQFDNKFIMHPQTAANLRKHLANS